jgi:hypothetical protein
MPNEPSQPALVVSKEAAHTNHRSASRDMREDDEDEEAVEATGQRAPEPTEDSDGDDDEVVAGTPPITKRFKGLFVHVDPLLCRHSLRLGVELPSSAPALRELVNDTDEEAVDDSQKSQ